MARSVIELLRQATIRKEKKKWIFNPDSKDFTCKYEGKKYTVKAQETAEFLAVIADHLKKHLANHLLHKRTTKKYNAEKELKRIYREMKI